MKVSTLSLKLNDEALGLNVIAKEGCLVLKRLVVGPRRCNLNLACCIHFLHVLHEERQIWVELFFIWDSVDSWCYAWHDTGLEVASQLPKLLQAMAPHVI